MSKTVQQILAADNLCGLIQGVVGGVPDTILPPSYLTPTRSVEGVTCSYDKIEGTRQTARRVAAGSPSVRRNTPGLSEVPVSLITTHEHFSHVAQVFLNLRAEGSEAKQKLGRDTIARQTGQFGRLFRNLRLSTVYSIFANGAIYFDADGNLLPSSTDATITVDMKVPAGNKDQLNVEGNGAILSANWSTAATDIPLQIRNLKDAALRLTGYPIMHAFYGKNIESYLLKNTLVKALIAGSPRLSEAFASGDAIPNGLMGLNWHPVSGAFYNDKDGTNQTFFGGNACTFTPDASPEWWEVIEGSQAIPSGLGISANALEALSMIEEATGAFSYAELTTDPVGIKHHGGDTFLTVAKVPSAMFIAEVPAA